jgi:type IV pilus assembly protein PilA
MRHQSSVSKEIVCETKLRGRLPSARPYLRSGAAIVLMFLSLSAVAIQGPPKSTAPGQRKAAQNKSVSGTSQQGSKAEDPDVAWLQDALQNRELMAEVQQLVEKLQKGIQYPGPRNQSRILPRLADSTTFYAAFPNYGETMHQALQIFQQELKESTPLRDFLRKNKLDAAEPEIENGFEKFYEFSQYLGDEIVIAGKLEGQDPSGFAIAEVKKPGVREFLEKINNELITSKSDRLRIFSPEQLAAAGVGDAKQAPVVLVRQDVIAFGLSVAALRELNSQLDQGGAKFASNALGQRIMQAYQRGASSLFAIDLQKVINLIPQIKPQDRMMLEKTGFADIKYLLAESTTSGDGTTNQGELTFSGPRHGIASWVAAPGSMGGLDFVSANPSQAGDILLKSPAQILDDLRDIMGEAAFASVPQMEAQLNVNLKQDLLSKLGGEIAYEVGAPAANAAGPKTPSFKVILRVSDPDGLQQTITKLLAMAPFERGQREEDGVTFHTLTSASAAGGPGSDINYFILDGYLVIASDSATAKDAVRAHRSGNSLAKSGKLRDSLARGQSANASVVSYQDFGQMLGSMLAQLPPEMRQLEPLIGSIKTTPSVFHVYAEPTAFRAVSSSSVQSEASVVLVVAAIAIPNLLRSRIAANDSAAVSAVRTINTAQVMYNIDYAEKGYAANLAALGSGGGDCAGNKGTAEHACLVDSVLTNPSCTGGKWCVKDGYKFTVRGVCLQAKCLNYVVTATPENASTAGKSFCSTSDGVIRSHSGAPLAAPLSVAECKAWAPTR